MKKYGMTTFALIKRNILVSLVCFALFYFECELFNLAIPGYIAGIVGVVIAQIGFFLIFRGEDSE